MDYGNLASKKQEEERIKHGLVKRAKDQEWIKARVDAWKLQGTCYVSSIDSLPSLGCVNSC
jgi:hypothetical protein